MYWHQTICNYLQKGQQSVSNSKLRIVDLKVATVGSDLLVLGGSSIVYFHSKIESAGHI